MKKNIFAIATIGILLLSCFVITPVAKTAPPAPPIGTTLYVGGSGPGNYSNIQDAIDDASDGYAVYVYSGTYYENIVIDKSINLTGENVKTTIIYGNGIGDVIKVTDDKVNISGFTIRNPDPINSVLKYCYPEVYNYYYDTYASFLDNFNVRFSPVGSCKLEECSLMLYIDNESWINTTEGIDVIVWNDDGFGFPDDEVVRIQVPASQISLYPNYTYVDFSYLNLVFNEDFHIGYSMVNPTEDYYAIFFDDVDHIESRSLVSYEEAWYNLSDLTGENNNFNITAYVNYGIFSGVGVNLSQTNNSILKNNIITKCKQGVVSQVFVSGKYRDQNNLIYHNNFINNTQNAYDSSINKWDNGYLIGGNYWDDYTGIDSDGDGIGDTPYDIPGGSNQDLYPLMYRIDQPGVYYRFLIKDEIPFHTNGSVNVSQSTVSVYLNAGIEIINGNKYSYSEIPFDWEISGDNVTTNSTVDDSKGRKEAYINDILDYSAHYNWYVNISADGHYKNVTFYFITEEPPNQPPFANFTYFIRDLTVFVDASSSEDNDGYIESYSWNFSDGATSTENITNHTYKDNGTYDVDLTVTDDDGATNSKIISIEVINNRPVANFTYAMVGGTKQVRFDASKSSDENGIIVSYFWEFGDGTNETTTGKFVDHTYTNDSTTYKVNLTVTDSAGLKSNTTSIDVKFGDMTDPKVNIDQPVRGLYIKDKLIRNFLIRPALIIGDITIKVSASDSDSGSGIAKVEFYINNKLVNTSYEPDESGLYTYKWTKDRLRLIHVFTIKVVAYDGVGRTASDKMIVRKYL